MENLIGKVIDNFRVVSVLGKGGMGIVYKAYDTKLDRYVAIKLLSSSVIDKERFVERFKREAKNQAKLTHPNIVGVYGFIEYSNLLGIVMEFVEGESLEKVIDRQGRFNLQDVFYILKHLLQGIGYAHQRGFVHRDIKPSNIILNKEGVTKIMDFGISKSLFENNMTKTGSKIGTVYYMSPEQIKGSEITNRSDIYSIGCTIYEMIVGTPPYDFTSEYDVMDGHLKKTIPKVSEKISGVPEKLDKILVKAMQKDANARFANCEEMFNEVAESEKQLSKDQTSYFERVPERTKKYKFFAAATFAGAGIFLLVLMYFVVNQVSAILNSNELEKFKKYSIQTLFESEDKKMKLSEITRVSSGVIANLNSVSFAKEGSFSVAVGDSCTILTSNNGGDSWTIKTPRNKTNLSDAFIMHNGNSVIVGDSSLIYYGINQLDSLIQIPQPKGNTFFRVKFFNQLGFVTGNKGTILKSLDGGLSWTRTKTSTNEIIFDVSFFDDKKGFAVGWNGTILATTNSGDSWFKVKPEDIELENNYLKAIDLNSSGYGLIVGGDGTILRTTDYGNSWDKLDIKYSGGFQKVKFINEDYAVIVGSKGVILVSKDKGETWNVVDSRVYSNLNGIAVSPYGKIFLAGVNGMIYRIQ